MVCKGSGLKPDEEDTQAYDGEAGQAAFLAAETNESTCEESPNPPAETTIDPPAKPNPPKRTPPKTSDATLETYDPKAGRF